MRMRSWYLGLVVVSLVYLHNTLPHLTMLPRVNVDEPWLMERGYQVMRTGLPTQPMLGLNHAYMLQVGYGYVLAAWMAITGVGLFQARLLAVVMGLGIVLMAASIGRRAIDPVAGWFAALLLALDSNVLGGMRSARTDIPSMFFVVCAFAAYLRGQRLSSARWFAVSGASLGLGMLCHGNAFWAGIILFAWFLMDYGVRALRVPFGYAVVGGWLVTCGPYLAVVATHWAEVRVQIGNFAADRVPGWRPAFILEQVQREVDRYRGWYFGLVTAAVPNPLLWVFKALIVAGLLTLAFGAVRPRVRIGLTSTDPRGARRLLILAVGGVLIFAAFINNKVPVYLPHVLFGLALAAGAAVSEIVGAMPAATRMPVALSVLILYGAAGAAYYEKWYSREKKSELVPYESTEATLRMLVPRGAKTVFASPQFWTPFHAEPETTFLSFAAAQPVNSGRTATLNGVAGDRPIVLIVDEYQWLPELVGASSSLPQWQRDWITFIEHRCTLTAAAYGTAHGTLAAYACALDSTTPTSESAPAVDRLRIVGGATEYRPDTVVENDTVDTLSRWRPYLDPRRRPEQRSQVATTDDGLRITGSGWPGIETTFHADAGTAYLVRTSVRDTRDGDLLYIGGWERSQVESLSEGASAGMPASLQLPAWFPRDRAFRATAPDVRLRIYSEALTTDFLISSLAIERLQPVR